MEGNDYVPGKRSVKSWRLAIPELPRTETQPLTDSLSLIAMYLGLARIS
jgi:hypothetical protein